MTTLADRRILRRWEVAELIGLSQATLYRMVSRGEFPRPVQISPRCTGWRADEVQEWVSSRPQAKGECR